MDPVYEAALAREAELQEELKKIKDFLGLYRTLSNAIKLESVNTQGTKPDNSEIAAASVEGARGRDERAQGASDAPEPKRVRVSDNPRPSDVVEKAVEVIRGVGRPLSRREIHKRLSERGCVVRGADPVKALGTMLWRSGQDHLVQIEGRGYWLKGVDVPPMDLNELIG